MFGRDVREPLSVMLNRPEVPPILTTEYVTSLREEQLKSSELAEEQLAKAQAEQESYYNLNCLVWLYVPATKKGTTKKLATGPYRVICKKNDVSDEVKLAKGG